MNLEKFSGAIRHHDSTWHDGGVALFMPSGELYALASERVGERYRHHWDSRLAYAYLKDMLDGVPPFGTDEDSIRAIAGYQQRSLLDHHLYHAAAAFYASPFASAALLVADGQGPHRGHTASTSLWRGTSDGIELVEVPYRTAEDFIPQSIGHFYTAVSALAGMQGLYEEGKTMGLAAYGNPSVFLDCFRQYAYSRDDGSFFIEPDFIYAALGNTFGPKYYRWIPQPPHIQRIWDEITSLRGTPLRTGQMPVSQDDMDIAYAGQAILEEMVLGLARRLKDRTGERNLCLSGGVALNCSANGKLLASGLFGDIYVMPAADDGGQAIGRLFHDLHVSGIRCDTRIGSPYLGPEYGPASIQAAISMIGDTADVGSTSFSETVEKAAGLVSSGKVIGWFQGRSEIGPRALGNRSILADPRRPEMREHLNRVVKHREWYRPVAPAVLEECSQDFFQLDRALPFMLFAVQVCPEKIGEIPSAVHIDGSARVQTVNISQNARFHRLLSSFRALTGVPVLINTSFNGRGEPIVESPMDAAGAFMKMSLDALVLGDVLLVKR